jgi:hypothetical protein
MLAVGLCALPCVLPGGAPLLVQRRPAVEHVLELRGRGFSVAGDVAKDAYDWSINLATPAALVAGAALASLFEVGFRIDEYDDGTAKKKWVTRCHMLSLLLMGLAFVFEIFVVSTLCGSKPATGRSDADLIL